MEEQFTKIVGARIVGAGEPPCDTEETFVYLFVKFS